MGPSLVILCPLFLPQRSHSLSWSQKPPLVLQALGSVLLLLLSILSFLKKLCGYVPPLPPVCLFLEDKHQAIHFILPVLSIVLGK